MKRSFPTSNVTGSGRRIATRKGRKKIAFGWYGGKFSHLDFVLPQIPVDAKHYCEVFGGSAAILIIRTPAPVETYNDIDTELVNFFRVLRDQGDALIQAIAFTPFSREELALACTPVPLEGPKSLSPLERARRFYVRARQTRTGLAQTSSVGRWAHCVVTSRAGGGSCIKVAGCRGGPAGDRSKTAARPDRKCAGAGYHHQVR